MMATISLPAFSGRLATLSAAADGGSGGDADQQAFLFGQAAGVVERLLVGDLDDFVDQLGVQHAGDKAGADSLDLVRAGLAAGEHGAVGGLDGDGLERRLRSLM